jgi:hypothetical protein
MARNVEIEVRIESLPVSGEVPHFTQVATSRRSGSFLAVPLAPRTG